eukprot:6199192-Pleurochrysis_carterae.AAC.1
MSPLLDDDGKVDMYIALLKEVEEEDFGAESATPVNMPCAGKQVLLSRFGRFLSVHVINYKCSSVQQRE